MTEPFGADADQIDNDLLNPEESLDTDDMGGLDRGGFDPLDDGWDAPDRLSAAERFGTTPREQREGESLDALLAEEEPDIDPYADAELSESGAVLEADVADTRLVGSGDLIDDTGAGGEAGVLTADDEGAHADTTAELIAHEQSTQAGDLTSEEEAIHLVPDE